MLDFIVNPLAGGASGKRSKKAIELIKNKLHELKVDYKFHFTTKPKHATEITKDLIEAGATDIIVIGGDGTIHEALNGFSNFDKVNLGIIPCGTGNDFADALNISLDVLEALDVILNGKPQYVDFMQTPTVRGLNVIGTGLDVEVLNKYHKLKKKTKFGYTRCLIKSLFSFEYSNFTATVDGVGEGKIRSFIAVVANGHRFGGGLEICPPATPIDKKLDFLTVSEMPKLKIIKAFAKLKRGKLLSLNETTHKTAEKVIINSDKPIILNVDGELYENAPFEVQIVSDTLKVYRK